MIEVEVEDEETNDGDEEKVIGINSKAEHMSSIMLVCNQFKEVRRTVGPTEAHWTDFMGYENGNSASVKMSIRGHWERFPIKVF